MYLTGHGGNGFLKFADREELTAGQLAAAVAIMRFQHLLLAVDTCQAASLPAALATPGALAMASSLVGIMPEDTSSLPYLDAASPTLRHIKALLAPGARLGTHARRPRCPLHSLRYVPTMAKAAK